MKGGARPGAGRPQGMRNKKTMEQITAVQESGETPLDFLLRIMRDDSADEAKRIDCAKAAAQYVHPKLSAVDANIGDPEGNPLPPTVIQLVGPDGTGT